MNQNLSEYQFKTDATSIEAHHSGRLAGFLEWQDHPVHGHQVVGVMTMPGHQRQGLATEMYNRASSHLGHPLAHDEEGLTPDGSDWAKAVG